MAEFKYVIGDLLSARRGIIVHGCNAQGVMGGGVAYAIKNEYEDCYNEYYAEFLDGGLQMGQIVWWNDGIDLMIANGVTQNGFDKPFQQTRDTDYNGVAEVFEQVFAVAAQLDKDVHIPLIGSGIGGGYWPAIEQIILDRQANCAYSPGTVDLTAYCMNEEFVPTGRVADGRSITD